MFNDTETKCNKCGVVLYSNKKGLIKSNSHKEGCVNAPKKSGDFEVGDKVRTKEGYESIIVWKGTKSPEHVMLNKEDLPEWEVNVFHIKGLTKVINNGE